MSNEILYVFKPYLSIFISMFLIQKEQINQVLWLESFLSHSKKVASAILPVCAGNWCPPSGTPVALLAVPRWENAAEDNSEKLVKKGWWWPKMLITRCSVKGRKNVLRAPTGATLILGAKMNIYPRSKGFGSGSYSLQSFCKWALFKRKLVFFWKVGFYWKK